MGRRRIKNEKERRQEGQERKKKERIRKNSKKWENFLKRDRNPEEEKGMRDWEE